MGLFADGFKELKKASEPLYKTPKSIQETIEIMAVAENGIFEVARNRYSKCYRFQDINYTTTMLANSEFVALLKQANTDSSKMAEVIGVSEAQLRFVTNTASGMGLIKCGSVVIPFDNQISKDTDLYRLYNTNLHEKIEMQKAKELLKKSN